MPQNHRLEIDGLRAIAVLAVVFYHFNLPGLGGGFVGVDIFFVISGYLIGGILLKELSQTGSISLANFYKRRIRRLAPAYVVLVVATFIASYFLLLPFEFREFGKSLVASAIYLSNVYFYRQAGYFDTASDEKVLLHTWSLSVEEQFYIFLPLLMVLLARNRQVLLGVLATCFAASLVLCIAATAFSPTAAFFLFPHRAWELIAGVLLAAYEQRRIRTESAPQIISWIGLGIILLSVVFITPGPAFPGFQALFPVLGTVLILFNGRHENPINRLLSSPLPVFIGLISYSLYLWHWPILVLSKYYTDGNGNWLTSTFWFAASIACAWISWRFVEQPFRAKSNSPNGLVFSSAAIATGILVSLGALLYLGNGIPNRFDGSVRAHIAASTDFFREWDRCAVASEGPLSGIEICSTGLDGPPTFLVLGDSHARAFKDGIDQIAKEHGASGWVIWHAGCPPLFDIGKTESAATPEQDRHCASANEQLKRALPDLPSSIKSVLLIGRWSYYAEGRGVGIDEFNTIRLSPSEHGSLNGLNQSELYATAVQSTIDQLSKRFGRIYVLRQPPEIQEYSARAVARGLAHGTLSEQDAERTFSTSLARVIQRTDAAERPFRELKSSKKIEVLDTWGNFCFEEKCFSVRDGRSAYFDNNHVTNTTSREFRQVFEPLFTQKPVE